MNKKPEDMNMFELAAHMAAVCKLIRGDVKHGDVFTDEQFSEAAEARIDREKIAAWRKAWEDKNPELAAKMYAEDECDSACSDDGDDCEDWG